MLACPNTPAEDQPEPQPETIDAGRLAATPRRDSTGRPRRDTAEILRRVRGI